MKKFFQNIFVLLNLILAGGILLAYLSVYVSPLSFWFLSFFGLLYPFLLLGNLTFILLWLFFKPRNTLISLIAVLIGFSHLSNYVQFKGKKTKEQGIFITSFNVRNFAGGNSTNQTHVAKKIYHYLQDKNPTIICLQEADFNRLKKYDEAQKNDTSKVPFFRYVHASKKGGPVTFSSYPIIKKEEIKFKESGNMIIISDIVINKDTIRIFNAHLQSYKLTNEDIGSLDSIAFNWQGKNYKVMRYTGSKLKQAFIKRSEQAEILSERIDQSPYEIIVCGDFNDTPLSYSYHKVSQGLKDAFVESGYGIGNTYLGNLPSLRIDYILHSEYFESFNFEVDKVQLSDHYPISCILIPNSDEIERLF